MNKNAYLSSFKSIFFGFSMLCVALAPTDAYAQATPGCDPAVMNAMEAKAQAMVAYDKAVMAEIIKKPDSVLALTCFNQTAAISAEQGGAIFSGDFTGELAPIVQQGLTEQYQNFRDGSMGGDTGEVDYDAVVLDSSGAGCTEIQDLWEVSREEGITQTVPYATFEELRTGNLPAGAGDIFEEQWNSSQDEFDALEAADANIPQPTAVPNFAGANTVCEVLAAAGGGC